MEILKDKKIIVGSLAVIGGIALVAYLLKPKAPRRNSEGFFNMSGFSPKPPIQQVSPTKEEFCNLPNNFTRVVMTKENGKIKNFCGRYYRVVAMTPKGKGFEYRLQPNIPNTPFYAGSFINQNGTQIISSYKVISSSAYEYAFINGQNC
jgi:hypothetical protein